MPFDIGSSVTAIGYGDGIVTSIRNGPVGDPLYRVAMTKRDPVSGLQTANTFTEDQLVPGPELVELQPLQRVGFRGRICTVLDVRDGMAVVELPPEPVPYGGVEHVRRFLMPTWKLLTLIG